jgi:hypothetical protein
MPPLGPPSPPPGERTPPGGARTPQWGPRTPPPSSEFLINSTISRDWSLKSVENSLQPFVPNEQLEPLPKPTQIVDLTRQYDGRRSRPHRRGSSCSMSSEFSNGSASITARSKRNAGLEVNAKRSLRNELEDEARLGSTPQLDIDSNTQCLHDDASEGSKSELSKAKHTASSHIYTCPSSSPVRL